MAEKQLVDSNSFDRRTYVKLVGLAGTTGLAGCSRNEGTGEDGSDGGGGDGDDSGQQTTAADREPIDPTFSRGSDSIPVPGDEQYNPFNLANHNVAGVLIPV